MVCRSNTESYCSKRRKIRANVEQHEGEIQAAAIAGGAQTADVEENEYHSGKHDTVSNITNPLTLHDDSDTDLYGLTEDVSDESCNESTNSEDESNCNFLSSEDLAAWASSAQIPHHPISHSPLLQLLRPAHPSLPKHHPPVVSSLDFPLNIF